MRESTGSQCSVGGIRDMWSDSGVRQVDSTVLKFTDQISGASNEERITIISTMENESTYASFDNIVSDTVTNRLIRRSSSK